MIAPADVEEVLARPAGRKAAMLLAGCGFAAPRKAASALAALAGAGLPELRAAMPELVADLAAAADPDAALAGLYSLVEAGGAERAAGLLARLAADGEARRALVALLGSSQAFAAALARWPEWAGVVAGPGALERAPSREELLAEIKTQLAAGSSRAANLSILRRLRRRESLRIAARDLAGRADLANVTAELSAVADAVIAGALELARRECGGRAGPLAVLALGKLGGSELNYSSDIDLVFLAERAGAEETRLAEALIRALDEPTPEGVAYRVDLRLRPEGASGPLVAELESALAYYGARARPWERQALVKCRAAAGDADLGARFLAGVESFVWGSGLSVPELARACALRAEMARSADAPGGAVEVKSGVGGIRDAEFSVQFLQMAHGANRPELRSPGTLSALAALSAAGLIAPARALSLKAGYEFLRRVEHCLQTMQELQLHAVPEDAGARAALARRLGYPGSPEAARADFEGDLQRHTTALRSIYTELCGEGASGADLAGRLKGLLAPGSDDLELAAMLRLMGFGAGRRAAAALRALAAGVERPEELLAPLVERLRSGIDPERGLVNLERIARSASGAAFLRQLATGRRRPGMVGDRRIEDAPRQGAEPEAERNRQLATAVLGVAERSDFLADLLAAHPEYLDALAADSRRPAAGGSAPELAAFRERELVRIGARDLLKDPPAAEVSLELSALAEEELKLALAAVGVSGRVVTLALGRLGGREMSYGSDLDLVFVTALGEAASEDERAVQEAVRLLASAGREVDARLRPAGKKGQLLASLAGYRAYRDRGEMASWERLALVRARPVAGEEPARAAILEFLRETLYGAEPPATLAAEVWEMRARLGQTAGQDDFKRGTGGLVDLEFLAQYLALAHGWREPRVCRTGTAETFEAAAAAKILPSAEADKALAAHRFLRRLEMRARVLEGRAVRSLPAEEGGLESLARRMGLASGAALRGEFEIHTASARRLLERTLGA